MRPNLMPFIMHPLYNPGILVDATEILPINEERTPGSISTKQIEEIGSILERSVVKSKCDRPGGRALIDDGANRNSRVGWGTGRNLGYRRRHCSSDRRSEEGISVGRQATE